MKKLRRTIMILKRTGTLKMLTSFIIFYCAASASMWLFEPNVNTIGDGLPYEINRYRFFIRDTQE